MAKDKIIQIAGSSTNLIGLTQGGSILYRNNKGKWEDISPPKELTELDDIPRFWFGKHKGEPIIEARPDYLVWCRGNIDGFRYSIEDGKLVEEAEGSIPF